MPRCVCWVLWQVVPVAICFFVSILVAAAAGRRSCRVLPVQVSKHGVAVAGRGCKTKLGKKRQSGA
jgi:hypothetical protein